MDFNRDQNQAFFEKLHSTKRRPNLSQIFEDDNKPMQSESKNLRYQPQSSHKPSEPEQQSEEEEEFEIQPPEHKRMSDMQRSAKRDLMDGTWKTVMAVVGDGYKFNVKMGRVGLALLRNDSGAAQLMVYKNKGYILSWVLLTKSKASSSPRVGRCTVIKREAYLQFFDEMDSFWSIHIVLKHDETKFMQELTNIGLNLNERPLETATASKRTAASATAASTPDKSNSEDSESGEFTFSGEDVISTTDESKPSMTVLKGCSTVSLIDNPQESVSKLESYLEDQRAAGQSIEKKMDLILQALCCLATNSTTSVPHLKEGGDSTIDSLLQANTKLLHRCNDNAETSTLRSNISDNEEEELLELEQKVLDYKKENRALLKSLKAKERAIDDLRNSTGSLCNELVTQNNELKEQNASLISAMSAMDSVEECSNCAHYLAKIVKLERRVFQLNTDLNKLKKQ